MSTVKEICLGVAVAGVVVGAGSAAATGVAYAETPGSDSHSAADSGQSDNPRTPRAALRKAIRDVTERAEAAVEDARENLAEANSRLNRPAGAAARDRVAKGIPVIGSKRDAADNGVTSGEKLRRAAQLPSANSISGSALPDNVVEFRRESPATAPGGDIAQQFVATRQSLETALNSIPTKLAERVSKVVRDVQSLTARTPVRAPLHLPVPLFPLTPVNATAVSPFTSLTTRNRSITTADVSADIVVPKKQRVLVIGVDGTNLGRVLNPVDGVKDNDNFEALMAEGTTSASTIVGHTTISNPSWTTILTGVWDTKSGVMNNIFTPQTYEKWPTVFNQIEAKNPALVTKTIADWSIIADISEAGGDLGADQTVLVPQQPGDDDWSETDAAVTAEAVKSIRGTEAGYTEVPDFLFTYLVQVDEAGHAHGGDSIEYADAVTRTDTNLGAIMDAVEYREANYNEEWTVIVVTDHGHQPEVGFGHGFQSPDETSTFVIARGPGYDPGRMNLSYSIVDVTPTVLKTLGVAGSPDFDGVPLSDKDQSTVTPANLPQALEDAIALNNYPDIATQLVLGLRTVAGAIPYYIDGFTTDITEALQGVIDQNIPVVSLLASGAQVTVYIFGTTLVVVTQGVAEIVGHLTGIGNIAPTAPPLVPAAPLVPLTESGATVLVA